MSNWSNSFSFVALKKEHGNEEEKIELHGIERTPSHFYY
jgi:hypothetical protein